MSVYVTKNDSSNGYPVYRKPDGSPQGRIGTDVELEVAAIEGSYARFINPLVLDDISKQWIQLTDIIELSDDNDEQPPEDKAYIIVYEADGSTRRFEEV